MPIHERILVTGGAGFVGSSVALALKRSLPQAQVTAFDNLHRRGSELNLSRLREAGVAFAHGDIRSLADLTGLAGSAGSDRRMLGGAIRAGRLWRLAGVSDRHQPDRLLSLSGVGAARPLGFCFHFHQPRLSLPALE